jgi:hypothetical protein
MKETEIREIEGRFWQPDSSQKFYGRISFARDDGLRVHFVGADLGQSAPNGLPRPARSPVLFGEDLANAPLTLLGFVPLNWRYHGWPGTQNNVIDGRADRLLIGGHFSTTREAVAALAHASLHGLEELLIGTRIEGGPLRRPQSDMDSDFLSVDAGSGVALLLIVTRIPLSAERSELRATSQWTCDPPIAFEDLEGNYLEPLRDLVLFATRQQSFIKSFSFRSSPSEQKSVEVLQRPHPVPREEPEPYSLSLNLSDHGDPGMIIQSWYSLHRKVGPVWDTFFAAIDRRESLLEDRLLGLLAFAEGYDRAMRPDDKPLTASEEQQAAALIRSAIPQKHIRSVYISAINHANSFTLKQRLDYLTTRAMESLGGMWDLDPSLLISRLADTRNWLIHWGKRGAHAIDDTEEMIDLISSLIVILYVNIVRDLGLDAEAGATVIASGWRLEKLPYSR